MKRIKLPVHIAFIMEGNGRWARRRFRPRVIGHRAGVQNMTKVCAHAFKIGVRIVTVFALSTENLSRPKEELDELFELFRVYFCKKKERLLEIQVKINVLGDISVGDGALVGAGSVVVHDVPANTTVVGNPARVVRTRACPLVADVFCVTDEHGTSWLIER